MKPAMSKFKLQAGLFGALIFMVSMAYASFFEFDRFNRACIRNYGCDGLTTNIKQAVPNVHVCQRHCDLDKRCTNFTWFADGMFRHFCFLFADCSSHDTECDHCYTGPRTIACPWSRRHH